MIDLIFKWQTLIGAVLGGMFALATALVVALTMRRREEVASGMVVVSDLTAVRIASEALNSLAEKENIGKKEFPLWFSDKLVSSHPKLSALFEASVARLMPVDVYLAAHLSLFQRIYSQIEIMLNKLSRDYSHFHEHGESLRPKEHMLADYRLITRHFSMVVEHSKCAEDIITKIILSNFSTWHRVRRIFFCMSQNEKKCKDILRKGSS
ncbi:MAG: hypothetical protein KKI12_00690 [Proteobacteria bacterium]|nr:hypothetical protein [Pseudomonadota bacterium]MBU4286674.1 hypothetical protein [Pseudomonadota bacterium]MCG2759211.1 hypothetical protein [Desulfobacteraceae bacterium]